MPFASINSTYPWTNPWNFWKKILKIGGVENLSFFESAILIFFCQLKKKIFCFIPMKIIHKLCDRMDGTQFWCFLWFPTNSFLCVIYITLYSVSVISSISMNKLAKKFQCSTLIDWTSAKDFHKDYLVRNCSCIQLFPQVEFYPIVTYLPGFAMWCKNQ